MRRARSVARTLILGGIAALLTACVMNRMDREPQTIVLRESAGGVPLRIEIVAGERWVERMGAGPIVFNVLPQIAIWAEAPDGRYAETLYVTGADFETVRHGKKSRDGAEIFAQALPIWASRVGAAGDQLPSKENPYPDSVTSATPPARATILTVVEQPAEEFVLYLEINKSSDENETFTKKRNGWAGQPSLIYATTVNPDQRNQTFQMRLIGHGGELSTAAVSISNDLTGFDSALRQIEEVRVAVE